MEILTLANGCVCYSVNGDLANALAGLLERLDSGAIRFDRLVIECTGLADPAPVAQTFFVDETLVERYVLDGIVTLVDAVNAQRHLREPIAQAQVGFADCILLSKTDQVDAAEVAALTARLQRINRQAPVHAVEHGCVALDALLDLRGFNLNDHFRSALRLRPVVPAESIDRIGTLVLRSQRPLDLDRLSGFMETLLDEHGNALLRYKGVLNVIDEPRRMVFQGVLRLYGFDWGDPWLADEPRESVLVFIGDNLPEETLKASFAALAEPL